MLNSKDIYEIISANNGIKATDIARQLGVRTSEVNSIIYNQLSSKCYQDDKYFWFAKEKSAKAVNENNYNNIKEKVSSDVSEVFCPKCGASMVKRQASKGSYTGNAFWGCSRYPHCKEIVDIINK